VKSDVEIVIANYILVCIPFFSVTYILVVLMAEFPVICGQLYEGNITHTVYFKGS
jgi:hypothetical protein